MAHGKGPRLFTADGQLISPDLLIFNGTKIVWIEAKTKSAFTWHRLSGTWQTGIDRRHWLDYCKVNALTQFPVWVLFFHKEHGNAKDTPEGLQSPSGLFGQEIGKLQASVDHEHDNHGPSGMVYWRIESLRKLAEVRDLIGPGL